MQLTLAQGQEWAAHIYTRYTEELLYAMMYVISAGSAYTIMLLTYTAK